jgi:hypothetical protein
MALIFLVRTTDRDLLGNKSINALLVHSNQRIASCPEQFEDPRRLPMNVSFSSFIPTHMHVI